MPRLRDSFTFLSLSAALLVAGAAPGHGQSGGFGVVDLFAPPAIEHGVVADQSRAPDSYESKIRRSVRALDAPRMRTGASGARYVPGKVIVKFRDGMSTSARAAVLSSMSVRTSARPSYADFEVINIDPSLDAEAVARQFAARPEVEYAQPVHRVHTDMVPNDPRYSLQWNLPDIDLERAWDIQPDAASSVIVAVIDTGIAFTNVTMRYHANAFVVDSDGDVVTGGPGTRYPSLGDLTLPFVAATDLGPLTRFVSPIDFVWNNNMPPLDLDGHGTHVSGTIGQATNNSMGTAGVAFNVKLMPVKVLASEWDVIFGAAPEVGG